MFPRPPRMLSLLLLLPFVVACASLNTANMVTEQTSLGSRHPVTVALDVGGGSAGVKWFSGTIPPEAFREALKLSLEKTSLFESIVDTAVADYLLGVKLVYAGSHPGFNMNAWVNVNWSLAPRGTGLNLWNAEIKGEGRATVGEAFNGAKRQFMALERAAQANIDQALTQIAGLRLVSP